MTKIVETTTKLSIGAQIILGIVSLLGFAGIDNESEILIFLLVLDTVVQFIELVFYIIFNFLENKQTYYRYVDWYVSTPIMLLSTIVLLKYFDVEEQGSGSNDLTILSFGEEYYKEIVFIVSTNAIMLTFGLFSELDLIPKFVALPLGSAAFVMTFAVMFYKFGDYTIHGMLILIYMCIIWGLYGIAAALSYIPKNVMYNILDIFSENFFGAFVGLYLLVN